MALKPFALFQTHRFISSGFNCLLLSLNYRPVEFLSDKIKNLPESQTIAMSQKSRQMKEAGIDVINLSLGEPDFNTPDFIKDAAKTAIDENYSSYPPVPGYLSLREAISNKFLRDNQLHYGANQIVVSTGAKQSIMNVVLSLVNPGDEVIIPAPYWVSYMAMIKMAGGTPIVIECDIEDDFKLNASKLSKHISSKTRLMIFSSPCNPSGSVYSSAELDDLASEIAKHKSMFVISDEIYEHILFEGSHDSLARRAEVFDQCITVNGVSKGFAMTGWRIGYIGAPEWIAKACTKMQGQFTSGASSISQKAAEAAVNADPKVTHEMRAAFKRRRALLIEELGQIKGFKLNEPKGAFYLFPDISELLGKSYQGVQINTSTELCMYLLEKANVAIVTGEAFGSPNCVRFSYATSDEILIEACKRISEALKH